MAEAELKNNYLSLYAQNADWKERVLKDDCEIVKYQNDSSVRYESGTTNKVNLMPLTGILPWR